MAQDKKPEDVSAEPKFLGYRHIACDLISLEFNGGFPEKGETTETISCTACPLPTSDQGDRLLFICKFHVRSSAAGAKNLFELTSEYINLVQTDRTSTPEIEAVVSDVIRTIVWDKFRSLYAVLATQSISHGPILPLYPKDVSFVDKDSYSGAVRREEVQ